MTIDEIRERLDVLRPLIEEAGCPRDVVLEHDALVDELERRDYVLTPGCAGCDGDDDLEAEWDQPPGPEWGA